MTAQQTSLKTMLGIELPLIQAPMAGVQGSALAVAVCNAGGMGSLPCAMLSLQALQGELEVISTQTSKPYNVNFFCHEPPVVSAEREATWRKALAPYYAELGLDVAAVPPGAGRSPFSHEAADVLQAFKPAVVSFHFGLPPADLLARVRAWGATVLASATTVAEARWLEAHGADAIIAQGLEAGGHRGMFLTDEVTSQLGTFALLPQIVNAVHVPVIAAGGIADAKGVAAALALGASAVQVGTAYMLCPEASTSALHRAALQSEAASHTALTNLFTGRPGARHHESCHAGAWPHERGSACIPAGHGCDSAPARASRKPGPWRFFTAVVGTEQQRLPRDSGRATDA